MSKEFIKKIIDKEHSQRLISKIYTADGQTHKVIRCVEDYDDENVLSFELTTGHYIIINIDNIISIERDKQL